MNKDLKYMPIDDKAGTFMSKHCSPVSYGSPLEKKSCGSPNKQIDPKAIGEKVEQVKRYRDYVVKKEKGYMDEEDGFIKGDPSRTVSFDRFAISEEIAKGGKWTNMLIKGTGIFTGLAGRVAAATTALGGNIAGLIAYPVAGGSQRAIMARAAAQRERAARALAARIAEGRLPPEPSRGVVGGLFGVEAMTP